MANRCPTAKVVGPSEIKDHKLAFRGPHAHAVATVEPCKGESVPVLVWQITPNDEKALDRYEGWPHLYRKETIKVKVDKKTLNADRKSTRLNSSHVAISYAVFCLKKKKY